MRHASIVRRAAGTRQVCGTGLPSFARRAECLSPAGSSSGDGAHVRARTGDLFLTKEVLCLLSYVGLRCAREIGMELVGREGIEPPQSKDG
jgi:hypothetical protein